MRIRVSGRIALAALLVLPAMLFAQSAPAKAKPPAISVTLEYFENNSGIFDVKDETGASVAHSAVRRRAEGWAGPSSPARGTWPS